MQLKGILVLVYGTNGFPVGGSVKMWQSHIPSTHGSTTNTVSSMLKSRKIGCFQKKSALPLMGSPHRQGGQCTIDTVDMPHCTIIVHGKFFTFP